MPWLAARAWWGRLRWSLFSFIGCYTHLHSKGRTALAVVLHRSEIQAGEADTLCALLVAI